MKTISKKISQYIGLIASCTLSLTLGAGEPNGIENEMIDGTLAKTIQIARDGHGNLVGVWESPVSGSYAINASTLMAGGSWSTPVQISSSSMPSQQPVVQITGGGHAVALWIATDSSTGNPVLASATRDLGQLTTWSAPNLISNPKTEMVLKGSYAVQIINANDVMAALWTSYINPGNGGPLVYTLRSSSALFGDSWSPPISLDQI